MTEQEPLWRSEDDRSDYEQYCSEEELLDMMRAAAEELKEGREVSVLFSVMIREDDTYTASPDYEGTLLGLEDGDDPHLVVGNVTQFLMADAEKSDKDVFLDKYDVMRVALSDIGSIVPSIQMKGNQ